MYNPTTNTIEKKIEESHKGREDFLYAIQTCDISTVKQYEKKITSFLKGNLLNIFNRVAGDQLRSYKNILLSHNTLYSYSAEKGGLHAAKSHFMSEKYAIMIEHADNILQLDKIHQTMIYEYTDPSNRYHQTDKNTIVEKAVNYMEMNFAEDSTIEEIAQNLHVHPSHLMRSFKKEKGMTLTRFRNKKRIKEAKELLIHTNFSMTEVAIMVGFNNSQYFSKIFKEEEGMAPKAFKKMEGKK